ATLIKTAREDAARRLARELERAVGVFAREAESVLAERLAHVGDAGAQRLERRLSQIGAGLERQRDELVAALEQRLADAESQARPARTLTPVRVEALQYGDRKVYSVASFNRGVASWLTRLPTVWVEGEVTELRRHQRWQSVFFTLKDPQDGACLAVTMPRGQF